MIKWILALYFLSFFMIMFVALLARSPIKKFFGRQVDRYINFAKLDSSKHAKKSLLKSVEDILTKRIGEKSYSRKLQESIDRAGLPLRASEYSFFCVAGFIASIVLGYILAGIAGTFLFMTVAGLFPYVFLIYKKDQRERKFHDQLPDTLSLIAGALKAGYSFLQAVDMTVKETSPPMSSEFRRVLAEAQLGLSVEQALDNMAARVESNNFDWTVMAVKIQKEVGGNLAEILEILADTIRERDRVHRQVKVLTAEGRLSAFILFALPFAVGLLIWVLNPGYLSMLFVHPLGIGMLIASALMLTIGGIWLKKVVTIEV